MGQVGEERENEEEGSGAGLYSWPTVVGKVGIIEACCGGGDSLK